MSRLVIAFGIFVGVISLFSLLIVGLEIDTKHVRSVLIGKQAPKFSTSRLLKPTTIITNKDFQGKVVVFNIWASWCSTCYLEHPFLMKMSTNKSISLYGLNYKDTRFAAKKMLTDKGNPFFANAFDPSGNIGISYGVTAVPETFIIDKNGIVRYKHFGAINIDIWKNKFLPLIKELNK